MHRLFVLFSLFVLSSRGQWLVTEYYEKFDDCTSSPQGPVTSVDISPLNTCLLSPSGYVIFSYDYSEDLVSSATCIDSSCVDHCDEYSVVTPGGCTSINGVSYSSYVSHDFPSQYSGPTEVFYGTSECEGDYYKVSIAIVADATPCPPTDVCSHRVEDDNDLFLQSYCTPPSFLFSPDSNSESESESNSNSDDSSPSFGLNGTFVVQKYYDSTTCGGTPKTISITPLGVCESGFGGMYSSYYDYDNQGHLTEYLCNDANCSNGCLPLPMTVGQCQNEEVDDRKRALVQQKAKRSVSETRDVSYSLIEVVQGFPTSLAEGRSISVTYTEPSCQGILTSVELAEDLLGCRETCFALLNEKDFCSLDSFLSSLTPSNSTPPPSPSVPSVPFDINGSFVVIKYFPSATCSGIPQEATIMAPGACFSLSDFSMKFDYDRNILYEYICSDGVCGDCVPIPVTLGGCHNVTDDDYDEKRSRFHQAKRDVRFMQAEVVNGFPTQLLSNHSITVAYNDTACKGEIAAVSLISPTVCYEMCFVMKQFCSADSFYASLPKPTSVPTSKPSPKPTPTPTPTSGPPKYYDTDGVFVVQKYFDSTTCAGTPQNATVLVPDVCWNIFDISLYYSYDNKGVLNEYFCEDSVCGVCDHEPVALGKCDLEDDENKRSRSQSLSKRFQKRKRNVLETMGGSYVQTEVVRGFPTKLADEHLITVSYSETACKGSITGVLLAEKQEECAETCVPFAEQHTFCSTKSFYSSLPASPVKDNGDKKGGLSSGATAAIVIVVLVVVGGAAAGGYVFYKRRTPQSSLDKFQLMDHEEDGFSAVN